MTETFVESLQTLMRLIFIESQPCIQVYIVSDIHAYLIHRFKLGSIHQQNKEKDN